MCVFINMVKLCICVLCKLSKSTAKFNIRNILKLISCL